MVWAGSGAAEYFCSEEHETGKIWMLKHTPDGAGDSKTLFLDTAGFQTATAGWWDCRFTLISRKMGIFLCEAPEQQRKVHRRTCTRVRPMPRGTRLGIPPKIVVEVNMTSNVQYGASSTFGPDGYLYVGVGDTGPQGDPNGNAQNMGVVLGKILRIDIDHPDPGKPYSIRRQPLRRRQQRPPGNLGVWTADAVADQL